MLGLESSTPEPGPESTHNLNLSGVVLSHLFPGPLHDLLETIAVTLKTPDLKDGWMEHSQFRAFLSVLISMQPVPQDLFP